MLQLLFVIQLGVSRSSILRLILLQLTLLQLAISWPLVFWFSFLRLFVVCSSAVCLLETTRPSSSAGTSLAGILVVLSILLSILTGATALTGAEASKSVDNCGTEKCPIVLDLRSFRPVFPPSPQLEVCSDPSGGVFLETLSGSLGPDFGIDQFLQQVTFFRREAFAAGCGFLRITGLRLVGRTREARLISRRAQAAFRMAVFERLDRTAMSSTERRAHRRCTA